MKQVIVVLVVHAEKKKKDTTEQDESGKSNHLKESVTHSSAKVKDIPSEGKKWQE